MAMAQATYQDADLIMKLYDMRREDRLRAARAWFTANMVNVKSAAEVMERFPPGSDNNAYVRMVISYWDMAASFVVRGVVHEELFFENSAEMLAVWERSKPFIEDLRKMRSNPLIFQNLEKAAKKQIEWLNKQAPGAYEGMLAMINPKK
jgi:hypothetical protein